MARAMNPTVVQPAAIIADDEPLLADQLRRKLARHWPELDVRAIVGSGRAAIDAIAEHQPHVCFLDIRMPGLNGIDAAKRIGATTRIVFVTAYNEYAVDAFDRGAVDYLLKPVSDDRIAATVERLKRTLSQPPVDVSALVSALASKMHGSPTTEHLSWIRAGIGDTVRLIAIEDVLFFQAGDKYTRVVTRQGDAWIRTSIKELASALDPSRFWQVHRSTLVNVREIEAIERTQRDSGELKLKNYPEKLDVSRSYLHLFRQM
jgi:DNA-binding LytR/AlgR family response regulator